MSRFIKGSILGSVFWSVILLVFAWAGTTEGMSFVDHPWYTLVVFYWVVVAVVWIARGDWNFKGEE